LLDRGRVCPMRREYRLLRWHPVLRHHHQQMRSVSHECDVRGGNADLLCRCLHCLHHVRSVRRPGRPDSDSLRHHRRLCRLPDELDLPRVSTPLHERNVRGLHDFSPVLIARRPNPRGLLCCRGLRAMRAKYRLRRYGVHLRHHDQHLRRLSFERNLHGSDANLRRYEDLCGLYRRSPVLGQKFNSARVPSRWPMRPVYE
jgi:hypothetical protein